MTEAPEPDDIDDWTDVYDLLENVSERDFNWVRLPTHSQVQFHFEVGDFGTEDYILEIDLDSGNLWLHHRGDDGTETVWKNKRGRY